MLGKYLDVVEHGQAPRRDVVDLKGEAFPQACSLLLEIIPGPWVFARSGGFGPGGQQLMVVDFFEDSKSGPGRARILFAGTPGFAMGRHLTSIPTAPRFLMVEVLEREPAPIEITLNWFKS